MSKIVCDICGTSYDDSTGNCPVCGWNPGGDLDVAAAEDMDMDDVLNLSFQEEDKSAAPAAAAAAGKAALDVKAAQSRRRPAAKPAKAPKPEEDEEEDDEEESGSNGFLVFILVLLILALLAVSAYIGWIKIIKPRMGSEDNKPQETISAQVEDNSVSTTPIIAETVDVGTVETVAETVAETTEPGIPCTNLSLVGGMDTLTFKGQYWRLMVKAEPDNTTEKVVYTSGDENVVTIDEYGRVTAVGEGETVIIVTCGSKRIETPAVVSFATEATEAATEAGGEAGTTTTTGTTVSTPTSGAVLKLKKTDVTIGKKGVYITLELENGISADDVKWATSDSSVATVWGGNVTAIGRGTCVVTARYNGQEAQCVVRVNY